MNDKIKPIIRSIYYVHFHGWFAIHHLRADPRAHEDWDYITRIKKLTNSDNSIPRIIEILKNEKRFV